MLKYSGWAEGAFPLHLAYIACGTLKLLKVLIFIAQKKWETKHEGKVMEHERLHNDGTWGKMVFNLMGQRGSPYPPP